MAELLFKQEVFDIAGAAMDVYHTLGAGFLEAVYHEALSIEFERRRVPFEAEKKLSIFYKGTKLTKTYAADFVCFESIVVEIKAVPQISNVEIAQLVNYLHITRNRVGVILNFGSRPRMEWKRLVV